MGLTEIAQGMLNKASDMPQMVNLQRGLRLMLTVNGSHQLNLTRDKVYPSDSEVLLVRQAFGINDFTLDRLVRGQAHTIKLRWQPQTEADKQTETEKLADAQKQADAYLEAEAEHYSANAGSFFFEDGQTYKDRWGQFYVAMAFKNNSGKWLLWDLNKSYTFPARSGYIAGRVSGYMVDGERIYFGNWDVGKHYDHRRLFKATFGPMLSERDLSDFTACEIEWITYKLEY